MPPPLIKGERPVLESSTSYMGLEGSILLTDRRLLFYCMEQEIFRGQEYEVVFDVPLDAIKKVSFSGHGLSNLIVETDTKRITGNPKHEFFMVDAKRWASVLNDFIKNAQRTSTQSAPTQTRYPGNPQGYPAGRPPQHSSDGNAAGRKFSKLCLNCMCVVPESVRLCPKCGFYIE
jgi:hypothetical protein